MKSLLEYIVSHLVDHPEDVMIEEREAEGVKTYIIHAHAEDLGKIIGKQGHIIFAIRTLAKVRAVKEGILVRVEVAESAPLETSEAVGSEAI